MKRVFPASSDSCVLEWQPLNGEVYEEEDPDDDNDPNADSLKLLLQHDAGWAQQTSVVKPLVVRACKSLKPQLMRAQIKISTTIKKHLYMGHEALVSRYSLQIRFTAKEGEASRDAEAGEKLEVELRDT